MNFYDFKKLHERLKEENFIEYLPLKLLVKNLDGLISIADKTKILCDNLNLKDNLSETIASLVNEIEKKLEEMEKN